MPENKQRTFFKYCTPDSAKAILSTTTLKWSSPRLFNDPFDGQIDLLLEQNEDLLTEEIFKAFMGNITSPNPIGTYVLPEMNRVLNFLRETFKKSGRVFSEENLISMKEAAREGARNATASFPRINMEVKKLNRDMAMFCVSEVWDSITMWGYYAKEHSGIVLEFLPYIHDSPLGEATPVNYVSSMPRLSAKELLNTKDLPRRTLDIISLTKYDKWGHEKEWRVVTRKRDKTKDFECHPFNKDELGAIILGTKTSDEDKKEIIKLTRNNFPSANIYQAVLETTEFKMGFKNITNETI